MSDFLQNMIYKAQSDKQVIVLAEGNDERTLKAAQEILGRQICDLIILGNLDEMRSSGYEIEGATLIDPLTSELRDEFADGIYELRKHKGMSEEQAQELAKDPLYFGVMLVRSGRASGMVAGACHSTADVLRPSLQILKTAEGSKLVSSFFVMVVPDCDYGDKGTFIFADCGLNVQPSSEELGYIAIDSARSWQSLIGTEPIVAMLSHSTKGSASNEDASKICAAADHALSCESSFKIDGELQADAAICKSVAEIKCKDSDVAGNANILIFPDLDAGNIGYKLVQRLAKAEAYGPITQGLAAPVNDLSRGCSAEDIVGVVAITCVQAIGAK